MVASSILASFSSDGTQALLKRDILLCFFEEAHLVGEKLRFSFYLARGTGIFCSSLVSPFAASYAKKVQYVSILKGCFALCFYFLLTYFTL